MVKYTFKLSFFHEFHFLTIHCFILVNELLTFREFIPQLSLLFVLKYTPILNLLIRAPVVDWKQIFY